MLPPIMHDAPLLPPALLPAAAPTGAARIAGPRPRAALLPVPRSRRGPWAARAASSTRGGTACPLACPAPVACCRWAGRWSRLTLAAELLLFRVDLLLHPHICTMSHNTSHHLPSPLLLHSGGGPPPTAAACRAPPLGWARIQACCPAPTATRTLRSSATGELRYVPIVTVLPGAVHVKRHILFEPEGVRLQCDPWAR